MTLMPGEAENQPPESTHHHYETLGHYETFGME